MIIDYSFVFETSLSWHLITVALIAGIMVLWLLLLLVLHKLRRLTAFCLLNITDVVFGLLAGTFLFRTLYLHYALICWIGLYFLVRKRNGNLRVLRYVRLLASWSPAEITKLYTMADTAAVDGSFGQVLADIFTLRKMPVEKTMRPCNLKKELWNKAVYPFALYAVGLIVPVIDLLAVGAQYTQWNCLPLILAEVYVAFFAVVYLLYHPLRYLNVEFLNTGRFYQNKRGYLILYCFYCLLFFIVVTGFVVMRF